MSSFLSIRGRLQNLPIPMKLTLIIGLFCGVVCSLLTLSYIGLEILSGVRAYVGGEGLWSKSQKQAVYQLTRYALTHDPADYQKYLDHMAIPLGDHQARQEMFQAQMNASRVAEGFVQGRNHPADVPVMTLMARQLYNFPYMKQALYIWGEADRSLGDIQTIANTLHQEIQSGHSSIGQIKTLTDDIAAIDTRLTPLEDEFSFTLGAGARWLKGVLLVCMILTTGLFLGLALCFAFIISRQLCREIERLRTSAAKIAEGDYSPSLYVESQDEIGDLARSLQSMVDQRQQAEKLKDEFFANMSHELRTPLTLILSPLESLLSGDQGPVPVRADALLKTMHNNTVRLLQLVNGLLDFSKLNAGKLHVERIPVRIGDVTEMIYLDFQPLLQQKQIQSQLDIKPRDAILMLDRYFYERIFFNLLSNAVKFTPAGGHIGIHVLSENNQLTLTVSDTGVGIPAGELKNIFQRFRQVEGSSTRRFEGTGLGLALVKELAQLLDGDVFVKSTPGQGSEFTVRFSAPAAQNVTLLSDIGQGVGSLKAQQYNVPALAPTVAPASGHPLPKVLIAEDNTEMSLYIAGLLNPFCETLTVPNGDEALKKTRTWNPDLVITDVMMPGRDGLSLCREMKATPALSDIPVMILTAVTHRNALLEGWKAGANEYLFKPFHPKELVTRVESLLKNVFNQKQAQAKILNLNTSLRRHAQDLERSNQELSAFSYSVSHDLRTPLRAIEGFTKDLLAQPGSALGESALHDLRRIASATQEIEHLIDDLLTLSKVPRSELMIEDVDISECVTAIAQKLTEAQPDRPVEWSVAPGLRAQTDPRLLHIALDNLLQNAWKFTRRQTAPKIAFGITTTPAGQKTFFIKDNGAGFDRAYTDLLFKPFSRIHKPQDFPGTGLGLALTERVVQRLGGRIWAEGEEGKGATFYFTLSGRESSPTLL